ncbi:P-loop containing nucleoside triphosphate hydrolase protein [Pisolithus marmoratus]|nr:P-loop containing nucleoside triphosphate hydrolase protein [Pisolithus marmoratus]
MATTFYAVCLFVALQLWLATVRSSPVDSCYYYSLPDLPVSQDNRTIPWGEPSIAYSNGTTCCSSLDQVRSELDAIDSQLLQLLSTRPSQSQRSYSGQRLRDYDTGVVIRIVGSNIYRFGDSNVAAPVFRDVNWTVREGECWAVIGSGSHQKTTLLQTLRGHLRLAPPPPPPGGLFPFLSDPPRDAHNAVALVSFAHRPQSTGSAFYDYTARYGAVRDEDRITLRESMFGEYDFLNIRPKVQMETKTPEELAAESVKKAIFKDLTAKLGLVPLLDLPLVTLSNGQTRRARIVKAVMSQPELLLLDEPLSNWLGREQQTDSLHVLESLHKVRNPRIIMGLRNQDPIPEWITHVALVKQDRLLTGKKEDILAQQVSDTARAEANRSFISHSGTPTARKEFGKPVAILKNVNVIYNTRKVLKSINWTIREGERWHLQGANGSGKTTLMSLITGDHPQSYTQRGESYLELFSRPRSKISTPHLRSLIGLVSPELANAYPRRPRTTVWEVIGTGFDGGFVPGGRNGVLSRLGPRHPDLQKDTTMTATNRQLLSRLDEEFSNRNFVDLSAGEQSVVLLMRALVGRPQLVLLDEVWSGMDDSMVLTARRYLREGGVGPDQAVVVVSHWEEEVPWDARDGLRTFKLEAGNGVEI